LSDAYVLSDLDRRIANMIRKGRVTEVDLSARRAKVQIGQEDEDTTDWIPWAVGMAGDDRSWRAPSVGEQVVVLSPGGDTDQGFIWGSLYQDDFPANGSGARELNLSLHADTVLKITIGGMTIEVTEDLAKMGAGASSFVALATACATEFSKIQTALSAIAGVLAPPSGTPGTPVVTLAPPLGTYVPASVAATKVKAE
jgi:phage baseplate assembly protein V